jgi:hypothetical protein
MALTDEQRSLLQLLLGGQSYDDIASLLGVGRDEVRSRARTALREIGGGDPDAEVALSDYLLGQADPIGRADAVRHLQADPGANALAERLVTQLRLLVPAAELPEIPAPKGGRRPKPAPSAPAAPSPLTPHAPQAPPPGAPPAVDRRSRIGSLLGSLPAERRSQLLVGAGALGLLLIVGVLAIAGVFGGGDDDDGGGGDPTATTATDEDLTIVQLAPLAGESDATGQAVFAQTENQPVLQLNLSNLEPAAEGETYIVWLYNSERIAFPVARDQVGENGNLTGATPIPSQIVSLVGSQFGCIDVSLASTEETQQALEQAVEGRNLPAHSGESVLRGQIPTQAGEAAPSGADSQCEGSGATAAPQGGGGQGQAGGN